jgi:hypothetical protein
VSILKAPFPWFGGKSRVADLVWSRLGDVSNYIEPFAGSLAVLLRRPVDHTGKVETMSDANHFVTNFWRAVLNDPAGVAEHADWPVSEADLHARHRWLMQSELSADFRERMTHDPLAFDARIAGWWVWGQCCWIGGGWCSNHGQRSNGDCKQIKPQTDGGNIRKGVHAQAKRVRLSSFNAPGTGVCMPSQLPDLAGDSGAVGRGVLSGGRPQLGDVFDIGRGVLGNKHAGTCEQRRAWLMDWMARLSDRLRLVRTCYGDWSRVCGSRTTTTRIGLTGVFLDPPYAKSVERMHAWLKHLQGDADMPTAGQGDNQQRHGDLYANDKTQDVDHLVARVLQWCIEQGQDKQMRIALCGYDGEHDILEQHEWTVEAWKAHGGYANRNADNVNKDRERIWFSPACIQPDSETNLFEMAGAE